MIESITVRGIGGIGEARLDFDGSFIVITGESGSGKSSLARAFEFVTGRRAHSSMIRAGCDEASVGAIWLDDGRELITNRTLSRAGRGRCTVDGELAPASRLAGATARLIDIQSQFSQLSLLDPSRRLELVDSCGGAELAEARRELAEVFPEMLAAEREAAELRATKARLEAELEGAPERARRIAALRLGPESEAELNEELARCERRIEEAARCARAAEAMTLDDGGSVLDRLSSALREICAVAPEGRRERWTQLGESALTDLQALFDEAGRELSLEPIERLEQERDEAEARVGALRRLKRETGAESAADLAAYVERVERGMAWIADSAAQASAIAERSRAAKASTASAAKRLRSLRARAASSFERSVCAHLDDLAMEGSHFSVELEMRDRVRAEGAEGVNFMLAPGDSAPLPVGRAASGGELSRILIAIQASIDASALPGTIVFDEVEAGLGGRAALLAGEKLRELSERTRVILITHEATIAAMASQHFLVTRSGDETQVAEISGAARESEIARMLSGRQTPEAIDHARALLSSSSHIS